MNKKNIDMKIYDYETKKVVKFKGINGNLETLEKRISTLKYSDNSYKIVTDILAPGASFQKVTLEDYENFLFDEYGIKNKIRANEISLKREKGCVELEIITKDQISKFISKLCKKYNVIATVASEGYNEDDEPIENLNEVTDCYADGTYESTIMSWEEYTYRYNSRHFWTWHLDIILEEGAENKKYDEFRSHNSYLNDDDIKIIEERHGQFKR